MHPEKPLPKSAPEVAANTLGIDNLSTHPSLSARQENSKLPIEFGRYRLFKLLGEGGMGAVFLAHDVELDRQIALKLPHLTGNRILNLSERFRREARLAATLNHPNICRIFDISEYDNRLFLTMEYVEGKPLNEIIKAKGAVESRTAAKLVSKIAAAVHFAHSKGILHRDLKPANIMIKKDRDFVIMDFGLARRIEQEEVQLTATGAVLGTPAYMAPEQLRADNKAIGAQSDVYSLGVILYELLTGQRPFQGTLPQIYVQVMTADSVSPKSVKPNVDPELDSICRHATAASVDSRYRTANELAKALVGYLAGQSQINSGVLAAVPEIVPVETAPGIYSPGKNKSKAGVSIHRQPIAIGATVGLTFLMFLGAFLFRQSRSQTVESNKKTVAGSSPDSTPNSTIQGSVLPSSQPSASTTSIANSKATLATPLVPAQNVFNGSVPFLSTSPGKLETACVLDSLQSRNVPRSELLSLFGSEESIPPEIVGLIQVEKPGVTFHGKAISPNGRYLAYDLFPTKAFAIVDLLAGSEIMRTRHEDALDLVNWMAFSSDGMQLVVNYSQGFLKAYTFDGKRLWGKSISTNWAEPASWNNSIFVGSISRAIEKLDLVSGAIQSRWEMPGHRIDVSRDGLRCSVIHGNIITVFRMDTGLVEHKIEPPSSYGTPGWTKFSASGNELFVSYGWKMPEQFFIQCKLDDSNLVLFRRTGQNFASVKPSPKAPIAVTTGDGALQIWNIRLGADQSPKILRFPGARFETTKHGPSFEFTNDGRYLIILVDYRVLIMRMPEHETPRA